MKTALNATLAICALVLTACLASLTLHVDTLVIDARDDLNNATLQLNLALSSANDAIEDVHAAAAQLGKASAAEQAYWSKTSAELYKTTAAARLVLVRTDHSLNDVLVPDLHRELMDTDQVTVALAGDITRTSLQLTPTLQNLAKASEAAAQAMADPHIGETLANVDAASAQLAATAQNVDTATGNISNTTARIDRRVQQLTTPPRLSVRIAEAALEYTVKAAQIAAGFFK